MRLRSEDKIDTNPAALRAAYGIRFHHFHDLKGRLVATIVTEPVGLLSSAFVEEEHVAVAAAILFRGADPVKTLVADIEKAIRTCTPESFKDATNTLTRAFEEVLHGSVKEGDVPSRERGRDVALGRLFNVDVDPVILPESVLKQEIADRTILKRFPGGRNLKLRPRAEFKGVKR